MGTYWVCRTSLRTASEMRVALFLLQRRSLSLREAVPSALGHTAEVVGSDSNQAFVVLKPMLIRPHVLGH